MTQIKLDLAVALRRPRPIKTGPRAELLNELDTVFRQQRLRVTNKCLDKRTPPGVPDGAWSSLTHRLISADEFTVERRA